MADSGPRPSSLRESVRTGFHEVPSMRGAALVHPPPPLPMETQLWDGGWGCGREGKGELAQPSKGRGPVSVPKGGLRQQGHPVPLREGGELAPLGHPVLSSTLAKSERENERRTRRARSQPSPTIPRSALTPQLQPQGEWGGPRAPGLRGPVGVCVPGRLSGHVGDWKPRGAREEMGAGQVRIPASLRSDCGDHLGQRTLIVMEVGGYVCVTPQF